MRKLYAILLAVLLTASVFAQAPQKMSYQAVIRNSSNQLVTTHAVGIKISILQGSATGTAVYTETITPIPSTNANGLVSIEIGGGTGFDAINWATGLYFIKTETDPAGGANYTITSTSQLLSVPYALHAKTAENGITSAQTSKLAGIADNAEVNVNADWNATSGDAQILNKPSITTVDGSETKVSAGTNVTVTGIGTTASPYIINTTGVAATHYLGELYGGGVVFYVDQTGNHGLICSMIDLSTSQPWSNVTSTLIGSTAQNDWGGQGNTNSIIGQGGHTGSAAKLCDDYTNADYGTGTYSDWYLPSLLELNKLHFTLYEVQKAIESDGNSATTKLVKTYYWASSEFDATMAWHLRFGDGNNYEVNKSGSYYVRAVRAF